MYKISDKIDVDICTYIYIFFNNKIINFFYTLNQLSKIKN